MIGDAAPEPGDIVISRIDGSGEAYALSVRPQPAQILCRTYDEALIRARRFAARQRIDVWVAENNRKVALVARHRRGVQRCS